MCGLRPRISPTGYRRPKGVDAIVIRERPAEAEDRLIPGHWDGLLRYGVADQRERGGTLVEISPVPSEATAAEGHAHVTNIGERVDEIVVRNYPAGRVRGRLR